jgi:hypothetical protein
MMFAAWWICIVVEGVATCELFVDYSQKLVAKHVAEQWDADESQQRRIAALFIGITVVMLGLALYLATVFVASGAAWWRGEIVGVAGAPTIWHAAVLASSLLLVLILGVAVVVTERAPITDIALLALYCTVAITQSFTALSHAPLQCAPDSLAALMYWLPESWNVGASVWPDASAIAHIVLPPLITVVLLVSVLRSHAPRDADDAANVPVSMAATLMIGACVLNACLPRVDRAFVSVVLLVVGGGEIAHLCGASGSGECVECVHAIMIYRKHSCLIGICKRVSLSCV